MTADEHRTAGNYAFGEFGQVHDFRHVRQVIA
jgi:hypothetical protein